MGKTIIQTIGPIYGEVTNGTVFGRPNGSIYIPSVNTISATIPANFNYIRILTYDYGGRVQLCNSAGVNQGANVKVVAESQDTQSYIAISLESSEGEEIGTARISASGLFNIYAPYVANTTDETLTDGETYNIVATLYSSSGVPVAVSRIPVIGKVLS